MESNLAKSVIEGFVLAFMFVFMIPVYAAYLAFLVAKGVVENTRKKRACREKRKRFGKFLEKEERRRRED